jgi:hypothetical protein
VIPGDTAYGEAVALVFCALSHFNPVDIDNRQQAASNQFWLFRLAVVPYSGTIKNVYGSIEVENLSFI